MKESTREGTRLSAADLFVAETPAAIPINLLRDGVAATACPGLDDAGRSWMAQTRFQAAARKQALIPAADGRLARVVLGAGDGRAGDPCGPSDLLVGQLAPVLPTAVYRLAEGFEDARLAAIAWGLGAYRFGRYKSTVPTEPPARLMLPAGVDVRELADVVEAVWLGRDLINTPASDMGPVELEAAARELSAKYQASVSVIAGETLLEHGLAMIHAVGRASSQAPRLIDVRWRKPGGREDAPSVTLVGKGITFDTGGLDLKPASAMLLMKKDMGGAATALALGALIMSHGLDVRLRILIPAAENAVGSNAFRPGDVLKSKAGSTVEIGNTDAEGRLVLADALAVADEEAPETLITLATLTGAARTALGPDLPALFCDDEMWAGELATCGAAIGDPVWRLPFWAGYERMLDSEVADINNAPDGPFAGAITAALFLRRFVKKAKRYAHIDLYAWRTAPRPLGPKGGEPQTARALMELLTRQAKG